MTESAASPPTVLTELPDASAEVRLAFMCARQPLDAGTASAIREAARPDLRWPVVLDFARWHCLGGMLAARLAEAGVENIPEETERELTAMREETARCSREFASELVNLSEHFQAAGVDALPFKGPALAEMAWEMPETRRAFNLDFLIRPGDLQAAKKVLAPRGFKPIPMNGHFTERSYWHLESQIPFQHTQSGALVALHQQIVPRRYGYGLNFTRLWERREMMPIAGGSVPALSTEDCLVILCLHAIKNGFWPRLRLVCDVAGLIARRKIDWSRVEHLAAAVDAERAVLAGLSLAHGLLSAPVPPHVLENIEGDPVVRSVCARVGERIVACELGFSNLVEATRVHASLRATPLARFRYLFGLLTTPSERDQNCLGRPVPLALSYFLRQVKLGGKCLHQLPHAIFRR